MNDLLSCCLDSEGAGLQFSFYLRTETIGQVLCFLFRTGFGVDPDDRLGIAPAHMYPAVGKVDLHAVHGTDLFVLIPFEHGLKQTLRIGTCRGVHSLLAHKVCRVFGSNAAHRLLALGHMCEE